MLGLRPKFLVIRRALVSCDYPGATSNPPCPGRELQKGDCSDTDTPSSTSWLGEVEKTWCASNLGTFCCQMRHKYFVSYSNLCGMGWNREREAELMWPCKLQPKGGIRWPQVPFGDSGSSGVKWAGSQKRGCSDEPFVTSRAEKTQIQKFGLEKWKKTQ